MMQPSMWTSFLIEWDPHQMVRRFAEYDWQTLELSDEHGHDLLKEGDPLKVGEEFRRYAADYGIDFPQGHFLLATKGCRPDDLAGRRIADISPADDGEYEEAMADMRRWIDLFNALGIKAGVLHLGGRELAQQNWSEEHIFARRVEGLARVAEYAKGGPTQICLENLTAGSGVANYDEIATVIEAVGADNVAICLDTGHANISGVDNPDFVRRAGDRLKALHVADNLGQNDDHIFPYGRGTVPWSQVLNALHEIDYDGLFNFEVPGENRCPESVRMAKLEYASALADIMIAEA